MQIEVEHPEFETQRLTVEIAWLFRAPRLFVNGSLVEKHKEIYSIPSDSGVETPIELKRNFFDPVPKMIIGNAPIKLARSFNALEYIWFVFLVLSFGNLPVPAGGLVGVIAAIASARVFRSKYGVLAKLLLVVLVTCAAIVVAALVGVVIRLLNGNLLS